MKKTVSKLTELPFRLNDTPNELEFPRKALRPGAYSDIEGYRAALENYWFSYIHNKPKGPAWKSVEKRTIDVVLASIRQGSITKSTVRQSFARSCERLYDKFLAIVKKQNDGASSITHSQGSLGKSPDFGAATPRGSGPTVKQVREALSTIGVGEGSSSRGTGKRHASKKKAVSKMKTPEYSESEEEEEDKHSSEEEDSSSSSSEESSSEYVQDIQDSPTLGKRSSPPQTIENLQSSAILDALSDCASEAQPVTPLEKEEIDIAMEEAQALQEIADLAAKVQRIQEQKEAIAKKKQEEAKNAVRDFLNECWW